MPHRKKESDPYGLFYSYWNNNQRNMSVSEGNYWGIEHFIEENDGTFTIQLEVPGATKEEVSVKTVGNTLCVEASRSGKFATTFERDYTLNDEWDMGTLKAELKNGILSLAVSKKESAIPQEIKINVG